MVLNWIKNNELYQKSLSAYEFQAAQDIRRRCTDMRCPVRHRELTNYVQSETALVSRARTAMTTARSSAYLKVRIEI